ncbi:MAG TPA: hypothetical protein VIM55_03110 [Mucilaginibacter sp.]
MSTPKPAKNKKPRAAAKPKEQPTDQTSVAETETIAPLAEQIMEVHHHPDIEHKPRHFKEYLLEGFMIFIAVMMGFIAENIREAINNHEHVQQLTSQLMIDLRADIDQLNNADNGETQIVKANDSLFNMLSLPLKTIDMKKVQMLAARSHSLWLFHQSTGAVNAIKNELHLEQFSNSKIISYISAYETHIALLHITQDIALQYQRNMLEPFLRAHFTADNLYASFNKGKGLTALTRNLTDSDLEQLRTDLVLIRINSNELITKNRAAKADAENLIKYVTDHFHPDAAD